ADGAPRHEHAWPRVGRFDRGHELSGHVDAARAEHVPPLGCPPLAKKRLTREIDHRVALRHCRGERVVTGRGRHDIEISTEQRERTCLRSSPRNNGMSLSLQSRYESAADEAGRTRDEDAHVQIFRLSYAQCSSA